MPKSGRNKTSQTPAEVEAEDAAALADILLSPQEWQENAAGGSSSQGGRPRRAAAEEANRRLSAYAYGGTGTGAGAGTGVGAGASQPTAQAGLQEPEDGEEVEEEEDDDEDELEEEDDQEEESSDSGTEDIDDISPIADRRKVARTSASGRGSARGRSSRVSRAAAASAGAGEEEDPDDDGFTRRQKKGAAGKRGRSTSRGKGRARGGGSVGRKRVAGKGSRSKPTAATRDRYFSGLQGVPDLQHCASGQAYSLLPTNPAKRFRQLINVTAASIHPDTDWPADAHAEPTEAERYYPKREGEVARGDEAGGEEMEDEATWAEGRVVDPHLPAAVPAVEAAGAKGTDVWQHVVEREIRPSFHVRFYTPPTAPLAPGEGGKKGKKSAKPPPNPHAGALVGGMDYVHESCQMQLTRRATAIAGVGAGGASGTAGTAGGSGTGTSGAAASFDLNSMELVMRVYDTHLVTSSGQPDTTVLRDRLGPSASVLLLHAIPITAQVLRGSLSSTGPVALPEQLRARSAYSSTPDLCPPRWKTCEALYRRGMGEGERGKEGSRATSYDLYQPLLEHQVGMEERGQAVTVAVRELFQRAHDHLLRARCTGAGEGDDTEEAEEGGGHVLYAGRSDRDILEEWLADAGNRHYRDLFVLWAGAYEDLGPLDGGTEEEEVAFRETLVHGRFHLKAVSGGEWRRAMDALAGLASAGADGGQAAGTGTAAGAGSAGGKASGAVKALGVYSTYASMFPSPAARTRPGGEDSVDTENTRPPLLAVAAEGGAPVQGTESSRYTHAANGESLVVLPGGQLSRAYSRGRVRPAHAVRLAAATAAFIQGTSVKPAGTKAAGKTISTHLARLLLNFIVKWKHSAGMRSSAVVSRAILAAGGDTSGTARLPAVDLRYFCQLYAEECAMEGVTEAHLRSFLAHLKEARYGAACAGQQASKRSEYALPLSACDLDNTRAPHQPAQPAPGHYLPVPVSPDDPRYSGWFYGAVKGGEFGTPFVGLPLKYIPMPPEPERQQESKTEEGGEGEGAELKAQEPPALPTVQEHLKLAWYPHPSTSAASSSSAGQAHTTPTKTTPVLNKILSRTTHAATGGGTHSGTGGGAAGGAPPAAVMTGHLRRYLRSAVAALAGIVHDAKAYNYSGYVLPTTASSSAASSSSSSSAGQTPVLPEGACFSAGTTALPEVAPASIRAALRGELQRRAAARAAARAPPAALVRVTPSAYKPAGLGLATAVQAPSTDWMLDPAVRSALLAGEAAIPHFRQLAASVQARMRHCEGIWDQDRSQLLVGEYARDAAFHVYSGGRAGRLAPIQAHPVPALANRCVREVQALMQQLVAADARAGRRVNDSGQELLPVYSPLVTDDVVAGHALALTHAHASVSRLPTALLVAFPPTMGQPAQMLLTLPRKPSLLGAPAPSFVQPQPECLTYGSSSEGRVHGVVLAGEVSGTARHSWAGPLQGVPTTSDDLYASQRGDSAYLGIQDAPACTSHYHPGFRRPVPFDLSLGWLGNLTARAREAAPLVTAEWIAGMYRLPDLPSWPVMAIARVRWRAGGEQEYPSPLGLCAAWGAARGKGTVAERWAGAPEGVSQRWEHWYTAEQATYDILLLHVVGCTPGLYAVPVVALHRQYVGVGVAEGGLPKGTRDLLIALAEDSRKGEDQALPSYWDNSSGSGSTGVAGGGAGANSSTRGTPGSAKRARGAGSRAGPAPFKLDLGSSPLAAALVGATADGEGQVSEDGFKAPSLLDYVRAQGVKAVLPPSQPQLINYAVEGGIPPFAPGSRLEQLWVDAHAGAAPALSLSLPAAAATGGAGAGAGSTAPKAGKLDVTTAEGRAAALQPGPRLLDHDPSCTTVLGLTRVSSPSAQHAECRAEAVAAATAQGCADPQQAYLSVQIEHAWRDILRPQLLARLPAAPPIHSWTHWRFARCSDSQLQQALGCALSLKPVSASRSALLRGQAWPWPSAGRTAPTAGSKLLADSPPSAPPPYPFPYAWGTAEGVRAALMEYTRAVFTAEQTARMRQVEALLARAGPASSSSAGVSSSALTSPARRAGAGAGTGVGAGAGTSAALMFGSQPPPASRAASGLGSSSTLRYLHILPVLPVLPGTGTGVGGVSSTYAVTCDYSTLPAPGVNTAGQVLTGVYNTQRNSAFAAHAPSLVDVLYWYVQSHQAALSAYKRGKGPAPTVDVAQAAQALRDSADEDGVLGEDAPPIPSAAFLYQSVQGNRQVRQGSVLDLLSSSRMDTQPPLDGTHYLYALPVVKDARGVSCILGPSSTLVALEDQDTDPSGTSMRSMNASAVGSGQKKGSTSTPTGQAGARAAAGTGHTVSFSAGTKGGAGGGRGRQGASRGGEQRGPPAGGVTEGEDDIVEIVDDSQETAEEAGRGASRGSRSRGKQARRRSTSSDRTAPSGSSAAAAAAAAAQGGKRARPGSK